MKVLVILLAFISQAIPHQTEPVKQALTANQVLAWRTYYGLPLDKDISEAIKTLGEAAIRCCASPSILILVTF